MKRNPSLNAAVIAALFASSAACSYAGPGVRYWATVNHTAPRVSNATPAAAIPVCAGSKEVAVTVMKPAWPNGRGPLTEVKIGTTRVCTVCPVMTVTRGGWVNGRGPETRTLRVTHGVPHPCTVGCP